MESVSLGIRGMTCASCTARVERALTKVAGVSEATVNLATERASVRGTATAADRVAAVARAGYAARAVDTAARGTFRLRRRVEAAADRKVAGDSARDGAGKDCPLCLRCRGPVQG